MEKEVGHCIINWMKVAGCWLPKIMDIRCRKMGRPFQIILYIRQLESTFKIIAYGRDAMAAGTSDTLLHDQFQEGFGVSP